MNEPKFPAARRRLAAVIGVGLVAPVIGLAGAGAASAGCALPTCAHVDHHVVPATCKHVVPYAVPAQCPASFPWGEGGPTVTACEHVDHLALPVPCPADAFPWDIR